MKVRVRGTNEVVEFSLYNNEIGENIIFDFMESNSAFLTGEFIYNEEEDLYACEQQIYERWSNIILKQDLLAQRIDALKIDHGDFMVTEVINKALFRDIDEEADAINYELDRVFS